MVSDIDINNAKIDLGNAEIVLIQANSDFQQKQAALNKITSQRNVESLEEVNINLAKVIV